MCVIAVVEYIRPTDEQVEQMWDANAHGGGVAYRAVTDEGVPVVRWHKGLSKEEMLEYNRKLDLPYVLHFRVPSSGTSTSWLACHPFQIDEHATTGFEGEISGWVLFHNGFWTGWDSTIKQIAINKRDARLPSGPWSDTRGLAFAAHHCGFGYVELTGEKIVVFGPLKDDIDVNGAWQKVMMKDAEGKEKHFLVSNKGWEKSAPVHQTQHHGSTGHTQRLLDSAKKAVTVQVKDGQAGGTVQPMTFPATRGRVGEVEGSGDGRRRHQQEPVQEALRIAAEAKQEGSGALTLCSGCTKFTRAGTIAEAKWYCWQCWAETRKPKVEWVGTCHLCKSAVAGAMTKDDRKWICLACWDTNGRPKIFFRHEEEKIRAMLERQTSGVPAEVRGERVTPAGKDN